MIKSLYAGVSGMKGFQTKLDVIGNNIANVNTVGFKKDRVVFQDIINQNLSGASGAGAQTGGVNPKQVGLGSSIAAIETLHTPGSPMTTSVPTDLAIDGDAYFVLNNGTDTNYLTRAGNFTRDGEGDLVSSNGYYVTGVTVTPGTPEDTHVKVPKINISMDQRTEPQLKFTSYTIDTNGYINVVREDGKSGQLAINNNGEFYLFDPMATPQPDDPNQKISLATSVVPNPSGLEKLGSSMYVETANTGIADFGRIENNSGGQVNAGILEMSNVELTEEFTEMIVAQRGFQANSRVITTSDSILEEIVNLKR